MNISMENTQKKNKKLKVGQLYDPAISPLCTYPKDSASCNKDTCSAMLIAIPFTIGSAWKQPKYPSIDEWVRKMCNGILFS